ncbi:MAG UNVERIFIED_CONTAM: tetratricopeptide repeat protein [Microcystis novacekii LVE1205-3]
MGQYKQALPISQQALEIRGKILGNDHPDYAAFLNNLAVLYESMGQYEQALPLHQQALKIIGKILGTDHPNYAEFSI